uniref:Uncharacterized protein n=1 Tax=Oryza meridionalis TaxID=40149 RepID=A0A0E0DH25_9ORYZ
MAMADGAFGTMNQPVLPPHLGKNVQSPFVHVGSLAGNGSRRRCVVPCLLRLCVPWHRSFYGGNGHMEQSPPA